jgi:NitT/TauT family transport system substrate-binding protein
MAVPTSRAHKLFDTRAIPGEIFDVLVVGAEFYAEYRHDLLRLLWACQAAHALAQRNPATAIPLMARREGLSSEEFRTAEQGLAYFPLQVQGAMLAADGSLQSNLESVSRVQEQPNLVNPGSALPQVSHALVEAASR